MGGEGAEMGGEGRVLRREGIEKGRVLRREGC